MGRSSSSRKKKRSKSSSQGRTKKRSKIRNRKSESKKKLRHYSSDDDDSTSSMSGSCYSSSSEDTTKHRTKKSHSQVRSKKQVVIKRKKHKKRSYGSESSDEESPITRKRKGSKRKRDRDSSSKSKSHLKKKRKRVESDSDSYLSDSISRETKRSSRFRSMSPICSDRGEDSEYQNEVSVENNSRRLRSIIVSVVAEREKEKEKEKEEVMFHDDYPSSRSNDSNDSGNKVEEHENPDGTCVSGLEIPKNGDSLVDPLGDFEDKMNEKAKPNDIEAVLRQRALENLRKFRRVTSSDQKDKQLSNPKAEPVSTETPLAKDTNFLSQVEENKVDMNINENKAVPVKPNIDQTSVSGGSKEKATVRVSSTRPKLVRPVFARQVSENNATLVSHESRDELKRSKSCLDETASGIVASEEPSLGETVSDKPQEESKDGSSEFENKTMSVMRGGEMVQVSYKVYIPKKVPALARRNLNR